MAYGRTSRSVEAARRFAERRRREDEAPRLHDRFPDLATLRLEVKERAIGGGLLHSSHIRPVLVDRAPLLFVFPCGDGACDGEHELTQVVARHLGAGEDRFEIENACPGTINGTPCRREISVLATVTRKS